MSVSEDSRKKMEQEIDPFGSASIKMALGFCALGLLAAVILVPAISNKSQQLAGYSGDGVDRTFTGSIEQSNSVKRYTVRKSVLHRDPTASCIIKPGAEQQSDCK